MNYPHLKSPVYCSGILLLTFLVLSAAIIQAQPVNGSKDERYRRLSHELWGALERKSGDPQGEKTEQLIVNSERLSHHPNLHAILASYGAKLKKLNDSTGLLTIEMTRKNISQLLNEAGVDYLSPDRNVTSTGHLETTTGTTLARTISGYQGLDGSGIGIAMIDSGIDYTHELFNRSLLKVSLDSLSGANNFSILKLADSSSIIFNKNFIIGVIGKQNDTYGHGTLTASLISGRKEFLSGAYTGIAPNANLLNLKVLSNDGRGKASDVIAAIDWCIKNKTLYNIRIINLSLGTPAVESYLTDPLCKAARRAFEAGIVVVAAAGNYGKDFSGTKLYGGINSPGIEPSVLTVGASNTRGTDQRLDDLVASYSSRGPTRSYTTNAQGNRIYDNLPKPDLVAPGNMIVGANSLGTPDNPFKTSYSNVLASQSPSIVIYPNPVTSSTTQRVGTMRLSGTSVAAPVVSGTVALMLQANPNLTPSLVKAILMYSAQPLAGFNTLEQGAGELNVHGALSLTKLIKPSLTTLINGDYLLIGALPSTQASTIGGQSCIWSQAVISHYGLFYGNELMTYWQGMYGKSSLLNDALIWQNGMAVTRPGFVSNNVRMMSVVMKADGDPLIGGVIIANGIVFADKSTFASGIVFADGRVVWDLNDYASPLTGFSLFYGDPN